MLRVLRKRSSSSVAILTIVATLSAFIPPASATTCATPSSQPSGNIVIASVCQYDGGTYDFTGRNFTINSGVTVTATSSTNSAQVVIIADNITIAGTLTGNGTGSASGTGHPANNFGASGNGGAGYGGNGGHGTGGGGNTYGSVTAPTDLGSTGGLGNFGTPGAGGGSIQLRATSGTLTISGTVSANGAAGTQLSGGGSGGSIYLRAATLSGTGTVTANGGAGVTAGGGGGGRIAITDYSSGTPTSYTIQAFGGAVTTGTGGGAGTIFLKSSTDPNGKLTVDDNNIASPSATTQVTTSTQTYDSLTVKNGSLYTVPSGFTTTVASGGTVTGGGSVQPAIIVNSGGTFNFGTTAATVTSLNFFNFGTVGVLTDLTLGVSYFGSGGTFSAGLASMTIGNGGTFEQDGTSTLPISGTLTVQSGGSITHGANTSSRSYVIDISAATINLQSGSTVTASSKGFTSGNGTGKGSATSNTGGGGAYGGGGGNGTAGAGGTTYGSVTAPTDLGSSGGTGIQPLTGGTGGGAIKLVASGTLTVAGTVSADGATVSTQGSGGGSGGSVWLQGATLAGSGTVTAKGGAGSGLGGGGGGGGRIAIYATSSDTSSLTAVQAYGATGGGTLNGGAGTYFKKGPSATNGDLTVDNNSIASPGTTTQVTTSSQSYDNLTVKNGARYVIPSGFTLTVASGGTVSGTGSTRPTITVNSGGSLGLPTTTGLNTIDVSNSGTVSGVSTLTLTSSTFTQAGTFPSLTAMTLNSSGTFAQGTTSTQNITTLTVNSGGTYTHSSNDSTKTAVVDINATSVTVNGSGTIGGIGIGYSSNFTGTGAGGSVSSNGAGGGGYGGAGGTGSGSGGTGGSTFGSSTVPVDLGGPGGKVSTNLGGAGGGAVKIVTGSLALDGNINVNGAAATNTNTGGGAGGSVQLYVTGTFSGAGNVFANGAVGQSSLSGCGGGGRVSASYGAKTYVGTLNANGASTGNCASAPRTGSAGTVIENMLNPVPTTSSISPTTKTVGGSTFTLTVNGTNFISTSVVRLDGSDRTTTYVSATQLTASIPNTDIAATGTHTITVFNPTPGGGTSGGQTLTVENPVPVTASVSPASATVGDSGFTLTVNGSNFVSGSVVKWGGAARTTTFVNSGQITASISSSDISVAGTVSVTVFNPTPGGGTSNEQLFTVNNPMPTTTSISPTSVSKGASGFTLTVNGTNFVSTSVVNWNGSARTTTFVSSTQLTAAIPDTDVATAAAVAITVTNSTPGGGTSTPALTFNVYNPTPTTTSISPTSKTIGDAGFTLTVNGTNFVSGASVKWNGSARTTTFVSATQLTASINSTDLVTAGTVSITVANPSPVLADSNSQSFAVNNPTPSISSLNPSSKIVGEAGFTLTVNGSGFVSGSVARFAGSDRTTTYLSVNQITVTIPDSDLTTAGTFAITVFNPTPGGGTSSAQTFTVNNPTGVLTTLSPTSATEGDSGFTLTVNGTGFLSGATVKWNGSARTTTFVSSTQLTAAISSSDVSTAGTFSVKITNPSPVAADSNALSFTVYHVTPTTTSLSPSAKTMGESGFTLAVHGTDFANGATVKWGGSPRTTTFVSSTELQADIPDTDIAAAGTVSVTVANPAPSATDSNAQTFTINNPTAVVSSISPTYVTEGASGFTLTVDGTDFINGATVQWNGSARTTTFVSSTQLTASIPDTDVAAAGTITVTVMNPSPVAAASNGQTFTVYHVTPTTASIAPVFKTTGDAGFTLTVTGADFLPGATVKWAGSARTTTYVSATQLTASIDASDLTTAGTVSVTVANPAPSSSDSNAQTFTVNNPTPTVTTLSPSSVTRGASGFTLTVNGTNFISGATVKWGGSARTTTFVSSTQLTAAIPDTDVAAGGTVFVSVANPSPVAADSNVIGFPVYFPTPTTTGISPSAINAKSDAFTLTVNGTNFVSGAAVYWDGVNRPTTFVSSTQLTADISAGDIQNVGSVSVTVSNPSPTAAASNAQTFAVQNPTPVVSGLTPSSKVEGSAGFTLAVSGSGFISGSVVKWNGSSRTTTYVSDHGLTASISSSDVAAVGTASVTVFNPTPGGGTSSAATFTIDPNTSINPAPVLTSISPTSKTAGDAGFTLTLTGSDFIAGSVVSWGTTDMVTTVVSSTELSAEIDASYVSAGGTVDVTVFNPAPGGGTSSPQTFTINNPSPSTSSISPSAKNVGDANFTVTVNGSNFVHSSVVQWAGSARTTTFVSTTQLTATINASDLVSAGTYAITVFNPSPAGGTSNAQSFAVSNPAPTITFITPSSKKPGDPGFSMTVNGTHFTTQSVVHLDGSPKATIFISSTKLAAIIDASDVASAAEIAVTVFNPSPGGGTSNAATLSVNSVNRRTPSISSISPIGKRVGDATFTLTVNGADFASDSVVRLDGTDRTTTFVNSTQLTATIPSTDLAAAAIRSITVFTPAPGGGISDFKTLDVAPVTNTVTNDIIMSRVSAGADSDQTLSFALNHPLSGVLTVTYPAGPPGFTVLSDPTPEASSPCLSNFGHTAQTVFATKTDCSGTVFLGGYHVQNPSVAGFYTIHWVNDDGGEIVVAIVDNDQVTVQANVTPIITFDLDTSIADTESAPGYSIEINSLLPGTVASSGSTVKSIWADLSTNSTSGAIVTVLNANGANGLRSVSVPSDFIPSSAGTMDGSTSKYGLCVISSTQTSGLFQKGADYVGGTCAADGSSNDIKALSNTVPSPILDTNSDPVFEGRARISVNASATSTTRGHSDYTDILTFIATGTF